MICLWVAPVASVAVAAAAVVGVWVLVLADCADTVLSPDLPSLPDQARNVVLPAWEPSPVSLPSPVRPRALRAPAYVPRLGP